MSEHHYAYRELVTHLRWEPSIPVVVQLKLGVLSTDLIHAKLDSGASHCYFHRSLAEVLEVDLLERAENVSTGSGSIRGWQREVEIVVPDWKQDGRPITLPTTVYFVDGRPDLALLGLIGFFNRLTLRIDDAEQQLWWSRP